jgi:signal transduction histidine kinase
MWGKLRTILGSIKTRVFVWYLFLLSLFIVISTPLILKFVFFEIDQRVTEDIREDIDIFERLLNNDSQIKDKLALRGETIEYPKSPLELVHIFNLYLSRRVPEDDTYLIGIIGEEFYRASPEALPRELLPDSPVIESLAKMETFRQGIETQPNSRNGDILYIVKPIRFREKIIGRLIVAHLVAGEREEALDAFKIVFLVMAAVFLLSVVLTWFLAERVLSPLKSILATARKISDRNLNQRIEFLADGELGELAKTFNEMMDRLESAFVSQKQFINDAGHELKTPITIIRGHLELLHLDKSMTSDQETIPLVLDELDRMTRLVDDLILLAKSERPDFLLLQTFELKPFINEVFAKIQALAHRDWQLVEQVEGRFVADRQRLTQAIMNLAQNAAQHTQEGDRITLGASIENGDLRIWVEDRGEGIEPTEQQRIFERFARVKNSRRRSDGSGLGLAIVKGIVEAHRGRIQVESQLGTGSTFVIFLPLKFP